MVTDLSGEGNNGTIDGATWEEEQNSELVPLFFY